MADQAPTQPTEPAQASPPAGEAEQLAQAAMDTAQASLEQVKALADTGTASAAGGRPVELPNFGSDDTGGEPVSGIELLSDVDLHVTIELGRTHMLVEDVLRLGPGSVVELDKLAGDPVDVYVNHRLIARGEVLVLNDNFCIRISEIVSSVDEEDLQEDLNQQKKQSA